MILESMFRGNFAPMDLLYPSDPEYKKLNQEVCDLADRLKDNLSLENQTVLDEMLRKFYTAQCIGCESYFNFGLAVGYTLQYGNPISTEAFESNVTPDKRRPDGIFRQGVYDSKALSLFI